MDPDEAWRVLVDETCDLDERIEHGRALHDWLSTAGFRPRALADTANPDRVVAAIVGRLERS